MLGRKAAGKARHILLGMGQVRGAAAAIRGNTRLGANPSNHNQQPTNVPGIAGKARQ